jgi:hypothetical protein
VLPLSDCRSARVVVPPRVSSDTTEDRASRLDGAPAGRLVLPNCREIASPPPYGGRADAGRPSPNPTTRDTTVTRDAHQTAPTQFLECAAIRFAHRRFGTGAASVFLQHFMGNPGGRPCRSF